MQPDIYVLLHNIRSLYNVGSLFRTCDGAGVKQVFLTGYTGYPPRKEISKTALGAEEVVPWSQFLDPLPCIAELKQMGVYIVGVERTPESIHYLKQEYPFPICLMFGNEVTGLESDILSTADAVVHVPMLGIKESLNVSVCGGIVLYGVRGLS